jgi:hypothetical protein
MPVAQAVPVQAAPVSPQQPAYPQQHMSPQQYPPQQHVSFQEPPPAYPSAPPADGSVPMGMPVEEEAPPAPFVRAPTAASFGAAARHAECPICFEPLHAAPTGVFLNLAGARVSQHFFNLDAAREWLRSGNGQCPITRRPVASVLAVPDLRADPKAWFAAVDIDKDGKLSKKETAECLKA